MLRYADRNSMFHSIESRVPFVNIRLVEFMLAQPEEFLVDYSGQTKSLFRHSMRGIVPDVIIDRKDKVGFETPMMNWLDEPFKILDNFKTNSNMTLL